MRKARRATAPKTARPGAAPPAPRPPRSRLPDAAALAVFTGFGAAAGRFAPLSAPAEFAVLAAGTPIVLWAAGVRLPLPAPRRRPAPDTVDGRGALWWLALLLVFTGWELYALFASPAAAHPTVSALSGPLLAPHWHRAAAYVLWLAGGLWLARR